MDLLGSQDIPDLAEKDKIYLDPPLPIDTAAGRQYVEYKIKTWCKPFMQWIYPLVMPGGTPKLVSAGVRCTDEGYGFWWAPYALEPEIWKPVINSRKNTRFRFTPVKVQSHVPYVTSEDFQFNGLGLEFSWNPGCAAAVPEMSEDTGNSASSAGPRPVAPVTHEPPPPPFVPEHALGSGNAPAANISEGVLPQDATRLKREALSTRHLLIHLPKNPYCEACCRGKAKRTHRRQKHNRPAGAPPPTKLGSNAPQIMSTLPMRSAKDLKGKSTQFLFLIVLPVGGRFFPPVRKTMCLLFKVSLSMGGQMREFASSIATTLTSFARLLLICHGHLIRQCHMSLRATVS